MDWFLLYLAADIPLSTESFWTVEGHWVICQVAWVKILILIHIELGHVTKKKKKKKLQTEDSVKPRNYELG